MRFGSFLGFRHSFEPNGCSYGFNPFLSHCLNIMNIKNERGNIREYRF
jgi:hypothetical protein